MNNQHHPNHTQSRNRQGKTLRQALQTLWTNVTGFMVQRSTITSQGKSGSSKHSYSAKAGLYPYLPPSEEQRDWLDKVYDQS
ncbi:MAG: hypothetical protein WA902_00910 [Thermosynechococcaceae cyanobacterium]